LVFLQHNLIVRFEKLGPFVAQAFSSDGKPSPAATGFAKSNGVDIEQLERVPSDKGERLIFRAMEQGRSAVELLPAMVEKSAAGIANTQTHALGFKPCRVCASGSLAGHAIWQRCD
jgi:glycyl-tRNA synthetase beta subunit